jgi:DNA polymerase III epsilon subunit-like protein
MLEELHKLMSEADLLVGWNSAAFDHKHINREFLEAGMTPPSTVKDLDLMSVTKANFLFPSNKLDYVAQKLGVGAKVKHSGFSLWIRCMDGDEKAWAEMKKYQIQDVNLLVDLYDILLPWFVTSGRATAKEKQAISAPEPIVEEQVVV